MKKVIIWTWLTVLTSTFVTGQNLPIISSSPTNITVYPGNTATFTVVATGATSYQWICNGTNFAGATGATLQVPNAQTANCGYYLALAKNSTGWVPSQMAYLTLDYSYGGSQLASCGTLPLSNTNDTYFAGDLDANGDDGPAPGNGTVQIVAGPQLDQMTPVGHVVHYGQSGMYMFNNGYYDGPRQFDPNLLPGQTIYYGVVYNYTNSGYGAVWPSTIMNIVAGTNGTPAPSCYGLKFPGWFFLEGVEPDVACEEPTNQLHVIGETFAISNNYEAYNDYGIPTLQWRKNGIPIPNATNNINSFQEGVMGFGGGFGLLAITNFQASDVGIYDMVVYGSEWVIGPKMTLSVQTTNGQGVFQQPKFIGTNLICNLVGAAGRNYQVQWSTNLTTWNNLTALSNINGTVTFTSPAPPAGSQFYRTLLLP